MLKKLNLPETIETTRLILRRLKYEDADEIFYTYASKPEATKYVSWPTHQSIEDTRAFLKKTHRGWNLGIDYSFSVRLKENNRLIGSFGVIHDNGKIQFGYVYSPAVWGNGYATEVCKEMMNWLRKEPNLYSVGTYVDVDNAASIRVLEKCGLIEEARLTRWFKFVNQQNAVKDCFLYRLPYLFE